MSAFVFHRTIAPVTKLVPFTVSVKADPPAVAEVGSIEVIVGGGALIVNGNPLVVALPESTVIVALPALLINVAGTVAVSCVALTRFVVSGVAFHRTTAPVTKLVPFTVSVNAGPPAVAEIGAREVIVGGGLIVNDDPLLVTLPETTVTVAEPAVVTRVAGMAAVS